NIQSDTFSIPVIELEILSESFQTAYGRKIVTIDFTLNTCYLIEYVLVTKRLVQLRNLVKEILLNYTDYSNIYTDKRGTVVIATVFDEVDRKTPFVYVCLSGNRILAKFPALWLALLSLSNVGVKIQTHARN
ncbi:hypothetical protein Tco_1526297, partial [Tanacetum coccineum]